MKLPAVERPNGKLYRPRTIRTEIIQGSWPYEDAILVLGTDNIDWAIDIARRVVSEYDGDLYPCQLGAVFGWWRKGINHNERAWVYDSARGACGWSFNLESR